MNDRERLKEATALLGEIWSQYKEDCGVSNPEVERFLASRAPAQPAAPTPDYLKQCAAAGPNCDCASVCKFKAHLKPAALPAIDENDEAIVYALIAKRTPQARSIVQPAAPEPSGAFDCIPGETDRQCAVRWMRQCMSAEAQLAAVLQEMSKTEKEAREHAGYPVAHAQVLASGWLRLWSLLTAPSPGAGEETL